MASSRWVRGILGLALTWAVALAVLDTSLLVGGVLFGFVPRSIFGIPELVALAVRAFVVGGAAGALFGAILARGDGSRTFAHLTRRRVGAWGFLAAIIVAAVGLALGPAALLPIEVVLGSIVTAGVLGASLAVATLAVARHGSALASGEAPVRRALPPV